MALTKDNVGKQCRIELSDDTNEFSKKYLGTIIEYISNSGVNSYIVSLEGSGECLNIEDDSIIEFIS